MGSLLLALVARATQKLSLLVLSHFLAPLLDDVAHRHSRIASRKGARAGEDLVVRVSEVKRSVNGYTRIRASTGLSSR
jgi:hypothetical protein